ncbi:MAG: alanine racemase [Acidobacteriota bacterium]|nr:alanine racemase [Acidobacteriota bacterium]
MIQMRTEQLATPALTVDMDTLERNLDRMARYCRDHNLNLRPHTKTHKTPEIARMQLARGAAGLTVAKVGEAEVMAQAGADEILVAFPIYGAGKLARLAALARSCRILVSLDSEAAATEISKAAAAQGAEIGVLVEFDAGLHRCGLQSGADCVRLAHAVDSLPAIKFRGLMMYPGNIWGVEADREKEVLAVAEVLARTLSAFEEERIPVGIVSGGSTPSSMFSHKITGLTEIRPGTYVFNDMNTFFQGVCSLEDCAARVVATVVSTAVPGRAMIDAGSKTFSSDPLSSGPKCGHGRVMEDPAAKLFKLNEEHGYLDISECRRAFAVGDTVTVIPNHVCTCVNMHDEIFLVRNGEVEGSWRVAARGKIR